MLLFIHKKSKHKFMKIFLQCPYCQNSLMDSKNPIKEIPSIVLKCEIKQDGKLNKGLIRFSAYYGDFVANVPFRIKKGVIGQFFCPFCHTNLKASDECDLCQAPLTKLQIKQGGLLEYCIEAYERRLPKPPSESAFNGMVNFCSRKGCKNHHIEFENPDADFTEFYNAYAPFMKDEL